MAVTTLLATLAMAAAAKAHESRPLYIEISENEPLVFSVQWKLPPSIEVHNAPQISMPEGCTSATDGGTTVPRKIGRRNYRCAIDPAGGVVRIVYPAYNPSVSTLIRVSRLSGEEHSILASPDQTEISIPRKESFGAVARDYLRLGVRHILEGYDHLLFLVCLLLIAGTGRRILITITGFTLAHSITLALSALSLVHVPVPPVEAAIALSIVFVAVEIVRADPNSLTYRYPIVVSSSFGLLHGFGFAAVLGETGLPQIQIPAALLFFNVGVELGQIFFVAAVVGIYQLVRWMGKAFIERDLSLDALRPLQTPAAYAVGVLAAFWVIERVAAFWTS